jgi:hypothetical protein
MAKLPSVIRRNDCDCGDSHLAGILNELASVINWDKSEPSFFNEPSFAEKETVSKELEYNEF